MDNNIKLSFCIPTYNRAHRVFDCVAHILQYPGDDIEVVVSNNASTDNTLELLHTLDDKRLKIYTNDENIFVLNWPLAVSRANGQWAVIMSDEDIVNLDAIPFYINKLINPDIGMIIYSFPPIVNAINYTYVCENQNESLYNAIKFCGHITGVVHNMGKYKIGSLDCYENFHIRDLKEGRFETQLQMSIENATKNMVMITETPICIYGRVEDKANDIKDRGSIVFDTFGGNLPDYRMRSMYAFTDYIEKNITNPPIAIYNAALRRVLALIGIFYGRLLTLKKDCPDILIWEAAREVYKNYNRERSVKDLCGHFNMAIQYLIDKTGNLYWDILKEPFECCFTQDYSAALPAGLSGIESIMFGDTVFSIMVQFYRNFDNSENRPEEYFAEDFGDSLGLKSREIMRSMMKAKDYDGVISLNVPDNIRTRYYKGEAYYNKNNMEKAEECFSYILQKTLNPHLIDDVIINEIAVQYSLYYMAAISNRKNEDDMAKKYLSDCYRISNELMIMGNLRVPSLPKID